MAAYNIKFHPIHLGLGATASIEPEFTGSAGWFEDYGARHEADGAEGRLVCMFSFNRPWEMWEMHPRGSEVVLCTAGRITLHQEHADGSKDTLVLGPGDFAINAPGTWHAADVDGDASAVFITSGLGTTHRPRE